MTKKIYQLLSLLFLSSCNIKDPIITDDMVKMSITCLDTDKIDITEDEIIDEVINEINNSVREGTEEMDFSVEHVVTLETSSGETISFWLFSGGKAVVKGYYIHSNIQNFCEKPI